MDPNLQKALLDRVYDKRKAATLELEKQAREALARNDRARINIFIQQLCALLNNNPSSAANPQSVNARNGGLIGLAGIGIALGVEIASYLEQIVPPVLACFVDPDSKIRYFACESFYNIAKVCRGEILLYFNEIFDALSKLAADTELSVKNGAELLDRLLKDIVCEAAPGYTSQFQDVPLIRARQDSSDGNTGGQVELEVAREKRSASGDSNLSANRAFSLARFVPLLAERIYVLSPFTRNYLVSWITVLDSIPELELVSYLPHFFDGLLKYLSDPNTDVRVATARVLADFLREIQEAAEVARLRKEAEETSKHEDEAEQSEDVEEKRGEVQEEEQDKRDEEPKDLAPVKKDESWIPAQEVLIDYTSIMEILLSHITYPDEEIQATTQQWIAELLDVVKDVVVPFTPRLVPAILPNIAHHSPAIQSAANVLNVSLFQVVQDLPWTSQVRDETETSSQKSQEKKRAASVDSHNGMRSIAETPTSTKPTSPGPAFANLSVADKTPASSVSGARDPFDLQATVNVLTLQLIDEHEETRVAALEWLSMLQQKAPRKILSIDDGTFPALLKTLSDPSEDVIRSDLRLLAQVSSASDDAYNSYLANLVSLFSTDRRLLETRGSLIIRQLCTTLHTERVFKSLAEILEKDEDLEFASIMITNLNMILITSPELSDFRKRLKNLETRDGQNLFVGLYRSWCHNAVATLSLCLLAQAYEHASNLLSTFPELEMTVPFLIQIDKLVQLLESPVFMTLRLQLLEPDRYPHLLKTLYGLLMLLPQSSAFATLRNRLNAVSALGYLHIGSPSRPNQGATSTSASSGTSSSSGTSTPNVGNTGALRSKIIGANREDLKWNEMLTHFKVVQSRHERARRSALDQQDPRAEQHPVLAGGISSDGGNGALGISATSSTRSAGQSGVTAGAAAQGASTPGARRRLGSSPSAPPNRSNSTASRPAGPSSAVKNRLRGTPDLASDGTSSGGLTASHSSFFRLPIGTAGQAATTTSSSSQSTTTPAAVAEAAEGIDGVPSSGRPTSPLARRAAGNIANSASAASSLLGRSMGLPTSATNRRKS